MEKGAFSPLAEEGQPAQLTEHAHRHRPLLLRGKMAGGCCPVTSSSLLLLPQGRRLDLNLRNAKMDLAGPRKAGIGRVWEGGQEVSAESLHDLFFDWKVVSNQLRCQTGSDNSEVQGTRPLPLHSVNYPVGGTVDPTWASSPMWLLS